MPTKVRVTVTASQQRTALFTEQTALGARFIAFGRFELPVYYQGIVAEHVATRSHAGLFDVSHMGVLDFRGKAAPATVDALVTHDIAGLPVGRARYAFFCNEAGGILDDVIVYRIAPDWVRVVCNADNHSKITSYVAARIGHLCEFSDATGRSVLLALQGPSAARILQALGASRTTLELAYFSIGVGELAGIACRIARTGYTGEDGFELFCTAQDGVALWRALLGAGKEHGLVPAGLGARDTLRLEAALPLYGHEFDERTTPFDAGFGWAVKLEKASFTGKEALCAAKAAPRERMLVGFRMLDRAIARHGHAIIGRGGAPVGHVTSGSPSPTLGYPIGLAYVPPSLGPVGTRFRVHIRGKLADAEVVQTPFYKRGSA